MSDSWQRCLDLHVSCLLLSFRDQNVVHLLILRYLSGIVQAFSGVTYVVCRPFVARIGLRIDFNERECVQTLYNYTSTTLFRVHREIKSPSFICKTTLKRKLYVWLNVYIYTKTTKSASQDLLFRHVQLNIVILLRVWTVKVWIVGSQKSRRRLNRKYFICLCFQIDTRLYDRADEFWLPVPIFGFRSLLAENHLGRGTLQDELVDKLALC